MKEFGKLTIKKGTVLNLDEKKNSKGGGDPLKTLNCNQDKWSDANPKCHQEMD